MRLLLADDEVSPNWWPFNDADTEYSRNLSAVACDGSAHPPAAAVSTTELVPQVADTAVLANATPVDMTSITAPGAGAIVVSDYTAIDTPNSWSGNAVVAAPKIVTYSFETVSGYYLTAYGGWSTAFINSFHAFTEADKATTRGALQQWDAATGLIFVEVGNGQGDIKFSHYDLSLDARTAGMSGWGNGPDVTVSATSSSATEIGSDIFIANGYAPSTYRMLHEIGHAIGLKHPSEGEPTLSPQLDNQSNTVMSSNGTSPSVLGPLDVQAGQAKYGSNAATNLSSYFWDGQNSSLTQVGTTGSDNIVGVRVNDYIYGGDGADFLVGLGGNDRLHGGAGSDRLLGGAESDLLYGDDGADILYGEGGLDTLDYSGDAAVGGSAAVSVYLSSNVAVDSYGSVDLIFDMENVIGTDVATATYNDIIIGNAVSNFIESRGGGDIVVAAGGVDFVYGGLGTDAIYGGDGADVLVGSYYDALYNGEIDYLFGEAGNDALYTGSAGHAYFDGGIGDDTISGSSATDYVLSGAGKDRVTLGWGLDLVILYASELVAGDYDIYLDVIDGQDFIYASASLAGVTDFGDSAGYSYMAVAVAGGGMHYTVFSGITAAQIQDQIFFNL
jgi:Ca2+-binding RTX toxin-like protein